MHFSAIFKFLGSMLMIFSLSMLPPLFVSILYGEIQIDLKVFMVSFVLILSLGLLLWFPFRRVHYELKSREGFLIVALLWITLSSLSAIPFYLYFYPHLSFVNAIFEGTSGLTTTGATIFTHIDEMPRGILYYRQQLHFIGGIGVILLAVAILPILGIGGMQLYRAETSGPIKTEKLHPRLRYTAKWLWYIYCGMTIFCILAFKMAGMPLFDAIGESFSAISTGGFALHESSLGYYHSSVINFIAIFFMILGSINFGLHYQFICKPSFKVYRNDAEFCAYMKILAATIFIFTLILSITGYYHLHTAFLDSFFSIISMSTTTGYTIVDFSKWPSDLPFLILFITLIGGCGASASGGLKVIRCLILYRQANCELNRLIHPQAFIVLKLNNQILPVNILQSIWGFFSVFIMVFVTLFLLLYASNSNAMISFSALVTCISNAGTGIGSLISSFNSLNDSSKWLLIISMLIGRLEIFTILVLLTPNYWKK